MNKISQDNIFEAFLDLSQRFRELEKNFHASTLDPSLPLQEIHTLVSISMEPGRTLISMAEEQHVSRSAITQMVKKLVSKGYVTFDREIHRGNAIGLFPTPKGKAINDEHEKKHVLLQKKLNDILEGYPPEMTSWLISLSKDLTQLWSQLQKTETTVIEGGNDNVL